MPAPPSQHARVTDHPGSSEAEIVEEPDWSGHHQHRVGWINRSGRAPGLTHDGDHADEEEIAFLHEAQRKYRELRLKEEKGGLVSFEEVMDNQTVRPATSCY
jgi:nitrate reductase (NAD(P)H)